MVVNDRIQAGSLIAFTKLRLFMLFFATMLLGVCFFFLGLYSGYNLGRDAVTQNIRLSIKNRKKLDQNITKKLQWLHHDQKPADSSSIFIVHMGLFGNLDSATQAWGEVSDYTNISQKNAIIQTPVDNQTFYQVRLGIFNSIEEAKSFANLIQSRTHGKITPIIMRTTPAEQTNKPHLQPESIIKEIKEI